MAVTKNDLQFILTGKDPFSPVTNTAQSIGGYPVSLYSPSSVVGTDNTAKQLTNTTLPTGYSLVDGEVIYVSGSDASRGALTTQNQSHAAGTPFTSLNNSLFNNDFDAAGNQYRCIAVKNSNFRDPFYNLSFYIRSNSVTSNTAIALGIEVPLSDVFTGLASGGTIISLIDPALNYSDNYFEDTLITFLSGKNVNQQRIIISSDQNTGTLVFDSALPFAVASSDAYRVNPKPAQRLMVGTNTPIDVNFVPAINLNNSVGINLNNRINGSDLYPWEVVYLWIRRTRSPNAPATLNNRLVISSHYKVAI